MNRSAVGRGGRLLLGSALVGALALAGCAPAPDQQPAGDRSTVAAEPAMDAARSVDALVAGFRKIDMHSAHVTVRVTGESGELEHGEGAYRSTPSGLDLRMSLSVTPQGTDAAPSAEPVPPAGSGDAKPMHTWRARSGARQAAPAPPSRRVELIVLGDSLYLKVHQKPAEPGKPWTKLPAGTWESAKDPYSRLTRITELQIDPSAVMDRLRAAGRIDSATREKLDGAPVTHYTLTVNTVRAAGAIPGPSLRKAAVARARRLPATYRVELWLTPQHLPMKIVAHHRLPESGPATVRLRYSQWDDAVSITAPPVDQVATDPSR